MRLGLFFGVCFVCAACGDDGDVEPLVPLGIEIGDIYTCVIEGVGDGVDDAGITDAGAMDAGMPDVGASDAGGADGGGVGDGLDPVIRPVCWTTGSVPQRLNLGMTLSGRIFLGDPLCNLADGRLFCFGENENGQVGVGHEDPVAMLTRVPLGRPVVGAAVNRYFGEGFTCAVFDNGSVSCWGFGEDGQLGNGGLDNQNTPTVVPGMRGAYAIAAGAAHVCVATADEEMGTAAISCWGAGERGQLGNGNANDSPTPVTISLTEPADPEEDALVTPIHLVAGTYHTCALDLDGEVWCWGAGDSGQLGGGATVDRNQPTQVTLTGLVEEGEPEPVAVGLAAGGAHTCIVTDSGAVACWGANEMRQAGVGGGDTVLTPTTVIEEGATQVAAGRSHSCALVGTDVLCWGEGLFLGTGTDGNTATPRAVRF